MEVPRILLTEEAVEKACRYVMDGQGAELSEETVHFGAARNRTATKSLTNVRGSSTVAHHTFPRVAAGAK